MTDDDSRLRLALIDAYRRELDKRYRLDNVRRYTELDGVSDAKIEMLRAFFLGHIYPPAAERERLDSASDRVMHIFRSPRQLVPLMGTAISSLWRYGGMIREAARVTRTTLETLKETRKLEAFMLRYAKKQGIEPKELKRVSQVTDIVLQIPEKEMVRFRNDVIALFRALSNSELIRAGVEIMDKAVKVMAENPETYGQADIEGFELGRDLLQASLDLYAQLDDDEARRVVEGIASIEEDWYEGIKQKAVAG